MSARAKPARSRCALARPFHPHHRTIGPPPGIVLLPAIAAIEIAAESSFGHEGRENPVADVGPQSEKALRLTVCEAQAGHFLELSPDPAQ